MRFIIVLILLTIVSYSQNTEISGNVSAKETKSKLVGASVYIKGINKSFATDQNANYKFTDIKPGTYLVSCECVGFKTKTDTIKVKKNESLILNFSLELKPLNR